MGEVTTIESENTQIRLQLANQEKEEYTWREQILPNWKNLAKKDKLSELVRKGIPVGCRGEAWSTFLENKLSITPEIFEQYKMKAFQIRKMNQGKEEHHSVQRLIEVFFNFIILI